MNIKRFARFFFMALLLLALSAASFAGVFVSVNVAPPPLPVYAQPVCPGPGYIWTPGYWAWGDEGYYWVPGTWVLAPAPGMLWTPGYWGFANGAYVWNAGYWGPHVGFYGGVNYGYGFFGVGFVGGEWRGGSFFYNSAVMNVHGPHITNVYVNKTVIVNRTVVNNISYHGGPGGIHREPSRFERDAARERHMEATHDQHQHENFSARNPQMLARNNGGRPSVAATARPGDFSPHNAVAARAAGGHVDQAALHATPRSMVATPAGQHGVGRTPTVDARTPMNGVHSTNEVHRPPQADMRGRDAGMQSTRNVPKPPAGNVRQPVNNERMAPQQRPMQSTTAPRGYEQRGEMRGEMRGGNMRQPAPPPHMQAPPQRQAPPQHMQAPPQRQAAPQQHMQAPAPQQHGAPQQHEAHNNEHKH